MRKLHNKLLTPCRILKGLLLALSYALPQVAFAETFYEVGVGLFQNDLEISPRNAPQVWEDDSQLLNLSLAAYRKASEKLSLGAVVEVNSPQGRDDELPGSGRILSFRPVNLHYQPNKRFAAELYGGIAQYDWLKRANGYCFGVNARYHFGTEARLGLALDLKYYMELAYDSSQGDDFVNGMNPGLKLFYRF